MFASGVPGDVKRRLTSDLILWRASPTFLPSALSAS
jgi:hypothetical protein